MPLITNFFSPSHLPALVLFSKCPKAHYSKARGCFLPIQQRGMGSKMWPDCLVGTILLLLFLKAVRVLYSFLCLCCILHKNKMAVFYMAIETFLKVEQRFAFADSPKLSLWRRVMALLTVVRTKFQRSWKLAASLMNSSLLLLGCYIFGRKKSQVL